MDFTLPKYRLPVDLSELASIFDNRDPGFLHYLDLKTGQVISISEEAHWQMEEIYDEYLEGAAGGSSLDAILKQMDLFDWQSEELLLAKKIDDDCTRRYLRIPATDTRTGYRDMVLFISTVNDPALKARLQRAIAGSGAFHAFKDLLAEHPEERQRWMGYKEACLLERVRRWLAEQGIEPLDLAEPAASR